MRSLIIVLGCTVTIISCQRDKCTPAKYNYTFSENKKIDTVRFGGYDLLTQVNPGNNIVFSYSVRGESCPNIMDGGGSEHLTFEIPTSTTNFSYSSADIQAIECYYESGSWAGNYLEKVTQGTLKGNKISGDKWDIEINVIIQGGSVHLSFAKDFRLQ